jgi:hypothetical protein
LVFQWSHRALVCSLSSSLCLRILLFFMFLFCLWALKEICLPFFPVCWTLLQLYFLSWFKWFLFSGFLFVFFHWDFYIFVILLFHMLCCLLYCVYPRFFFKSSS